MLRSIFACALLAASGLFSHVAAATTIVSNSTPPPALAAEAIRLNLADAQFVLAGAGDAVAQARQHYDTHFAGVFQTLAPDANTRAQAALALAAQAVTQDNEPRYASAQAQLWTSLLQGAYDITTQAIRTGDGATAQVWLPLRDFRHSTRFSRPNADAAVALDEFVAGKLTANDTLNALNADLLDAYQARLTLALGDIQSAERQNYATRRAEAAALAEGYFHLLAPALGEQRGPKTLDAAAALFANMTRKSQNGESIAPLLTQAEALFNGFRAAPLSNEEQMRRAGQLLRFISLVSVEYGRAIRGIPGAYEVGVDLEVREAITFRDGAFAAFSDLRTLMAARNANHIELAAQKFASLDLQLQHASKHTAVADPADIAAQVAQITTLLRETMPAEWQHQDSNADFDVIKVALDGMEQATIAGRYDLAESARLDAYAILESGPEAKLTAFAPQHVRPIEYLFWYGDADSPGLAQLLASNASAVEVKIARRALDAELKQAQKALIGSNAPAAVATNAAIIVFREGLEAVLILASLMASFKQAANRHLRKPMWIGTGLALVATVVTWLIIREAIQTFARYGEKLEAVVSIVAIAVLLVITNWFFHEVYWTGWMANFHQQKKRLVSGATGQFLGLVVLGFTSIYREGFETALFLQALVLESGLEVVLMGVAAGLIGTLLVGVLVFVVQAKLPQKKMLVFTGIMIGVVLLVMVGNTAHVLQVVGWFPTHPLRVVQFPYWFGIWFGTFATWEGLIAQAAAATFVIGSYFLAEWAHKKGASGKVQGSSGKLAI